jgi:hypothetical protein
MKKICLPVKFKNSTNSTKKPGLATKNINQIKNPSEHVANQSRNIKRKNKLKTI